MVSHIFTAVTLNMREIYNENIWKQVVEENIPP
jgi:hypothetical protein